MRIAENKTGVELQGALERLNGSVVLMECLQEEASIVYGARPVRVFRQHLVQKTFGAPEIDGRVEIDEVPGRDRVHARIFAETLFGSRDRACSNSRKASDRFSRHGPSCSAARPRSMRSLTAIAPASLLCLARAYVI
jgi:hypothetical protein